VSVFDPVDMVSFRTFLDLAVMIGVCQYTEVVGIQSFTKGI